MDSKCVFVSQLFFKMKKAISLFCFLSIFLGVTAQKHETNPVFTGLEKEIINAKFQKILDLSSFYTNKNLDSALFYALKAQNMLVSSKADTSTIALYLNLGDIYNATGNFETSLKYYFDAKNITDSLLLLHPDSKSLMSKQINLLIKIGNSFFSQRNFEQSMTYYEAAFQKIVLEKPGENQESDKTRLRLLNNMAAVHIQFKNYDKALLSYQSALVIIENQHDDMLESSIFNNMGICYLENGQFNLADFYFNKALKIREEINDKRGIAQCFNNIAKNAVQQKNYALAREYYEKALNLGREIGNKESILNSLQSLSTLYHETQNDRQAYLTFIEYSILKDSLYNVQNMNRIAQIEMKYKFDQQQNLFDMELKRRENERQKAELLYLIIGGSLFFFLLISVLLIFLQRGRIRNDRLFKDKLELEHKNTLLEKQKLKEELEFKNRELTTNVMYLLKKNELITGISEKLIKAKPSFKTENQKIISEIIQQLKSGSENDIWSEFEAHFTNVHHGFYDRLADLCPTLSSNEKKLCAFLRLNLSTKDISTITTQSVNSITVARSRLRKKLQIQGEDVNLINFLMQL